jgi:hypothetical protein
MDTGFMLSVSRRHIYGLAWCENGADPAELIRKVYIYTCLWRGAVHVGTVRPEI